MFKIYEKKIAPNILHTIKSKYNIFKLQQLPVNGVWFRLTRNVRTKLKQLLSSSLYISLEIVSYSLHAVHYSSYSMTIKVNKVMPHKLIKKLKKLELFGTIDVFISL